MMNFDGQECRDGFQKAFGKPLDDLTVEQVRWLVNVIKHCRGRCRSNAALNNYLSRNFTGHIFKEFQRPEEDFTRLEIIPKASARPKGNIMPTKPWVDDSNPVDALAEVMGGTSLPDEKENQ